MTELDTPDTLAPLRKLASPGQVAALRAECAALGRRVAQLGAANAEHWLRLSEAQERIAAGGKTYWIGSMRRWI